MEAATAATHTGAGAPAGARDAAAGSAPAAEAQTHAPPAAAAAAQATAAEAAAAAAPEAQAGAGATGMEVDAATIPEAASAAAAAAGEEEPESPCARQHTQAVNSTPLRRPRALHLTATEPAGGGPAATGVDSSAHDASYHTPSPASQRQLPPPLAPQPTPITAAMSSAAWLQGTVAGQGEGPPPQLRALMQAAGMDAGAEARLVAAAEGMAKAAFPDCPAPLDGPLLALEQSTTAARRSQGLRLYWRVLQSLVAAEAGRPDAGPAAAAALLAAPLLHRCVAACALECVISSYRMVNLAFPAVLERLSLPAFDLCKAVEPFVHALPTLPRDLKRHMLAVEERCLESLAWAQGSSLYPTLIAAVGSHGGGASGSGGGSSASERASLEAAPAGGSHEPACSPTSSPSVGDSVGGGERRAGSVTPRKRGLEEMAAPGGADGADADMADAAPPLVHPPEHQQGAASAPAPGGGTLGSATQPHSQRWPPQRERRHQHEQSGVDTPGRLPLSLGSEPRAAAAVRGASGDQQPASTDAAGPASALMPRGDRSARSAVNKFLRRVLKLAAIRLADLLSRLDTHPADPHVLLAEAFTLAQHVAFEQTWLLYGRHLDQALLCCLYSVCKLHQLGQASFKAIIAAYKQQAQAQADTFKSVSMRPREHTTLHQLHPTATADIITFYNQVFIPHTRAFLLRLADNRSLLVQPTPSALPYLVPQTARGQPGGIPSPPSLLVRGGQPPSMQKPCLPALAAGHPGSPPPRGLAGTPTRGGAGGMLLLSPGAWRINRGGMTPLASPRAGTADQIATLRVAGSPTLFAGARSPPSAPLSPAAIHHMFGLPGSAAAASSSPPAFASPAAAAAAGVAPVPPLLPAPPPAAPLVSDAAVRQMFAGADAAAAAAAAAAMQGDARPQHHPQRQQQQAWQQPSAQQAGREEGVGGLDELPSENLPLLAAAAVAAEEIERKGHEVAAAFSSLRPPQPSTIPATTQPPPSQQWVQQQPDAALPPAAAPSPLAAAAGLAADAPGALLAPVPHAQQQQLAPPLASPRHARRILALQPSPVQ